MAEQPGGGGGGDNLVIHTMKDDLSGAGKKPPSPASGTASVTAPAAKPSPAPVPSPMASPAPKSSLPASPPLPTPLTPPPSKPLTPTPTPVKPLPPVPVTAASANFPLPPRGQEAAPVPSEPISIPRNIAKRNRKRLLTWGGAILLFLLVVGGGAWAFITFVSAPPAAPEETLTPVADVSKILPTGTGLAVHYRLATPADRSQLLEMWQDSPKTLLQGNPKTLLDDPNVTQFMYVGIPGETRPFLVIPKSEMSEQNLSQFSAAQVLEEQGWYILHGLNATPYQDSLRQGAGLNGPVAALLDEKTDTRPLKMYLSEIALNQIRATGAGEVFAAGSLKSAGLLVGVTPNKTSLRFEGVGEVNLLASPGTAPAAGQVDQALFSEVPGDATFVRLGANLSADIAAWQDVAQVLDKTVLEQPVVAALVRQFTGPYAYYHRLGADGTPDVGLAIKLPPTITPALALGDPALEQALSALLPLIVPSRPAVTLAFADAAYQQVPLRFLNLGGSTKAIDYTIEKGVLRIASSKEGMFAALDVSGRRAPALEVSEPWKTTLAEWGVVPVTSELLLGYMKLTALSELLPTQMAEISGGLTQEDSTDGGLRLSGVIVLKEKATSSAAPSATPTGSVSVTPTPTSTPKPTATTNPVPF